MIGKKLLHGFLAVSMGISLLMPNGSMLIRADEAAAPKDVQVSVDVDITMKNQYMSRTFSIKDDTLSTKAITNKRTDGGDTVFNPAPGSEEFVINMTQEDTGIPEGPAGLDRTGWVAEADSRENASGDSDGPASNLIDGKLGSIWHTNYGGGVGPQEMPHWVKFTLPEAKKIRAFSYTPRQQGEDTNGNIKDYELYISNTAEGLDDESSLVAKGSFKYDGVNPVYVNLDQEYTGQYVKLVAVSAKNGQQFAAGSEFNLYDHEVEVSEGPKHAFKASDLTLDGYDIENTTDKPGKKLTFTFEPYTFEGVEYMINEALVMYDGDHFMRKFLEIEIPDKDKATTAIDYIDLESMNVNEDDQQWTIPTDAGGVVEMDQYKANLGQPIYIQGMFFGCEFPVTDTQIEEGNGFIRYYTGKTFDRLQKDNQLTKDGKYVTWQTVAGSARSTEMDVIQSDFFQYIDSIATPTDFRIQYNSWFDNMMLIDDANIESSFKAVEEEMSNTGVRPLDSYVVDDGWNNYNNTGIIDSGRSGTTLNQTGFWEFNSKFPKGLTVSSDLAHDFNSAMGVWVGPRGGYNFYSSLADILTKSGKGSKAGGSIDVADRTYVKNFQDMSTKFQDDYGVNYWKWDGFADRAQFGAFPATNGVPGYANNHMTGGFKNMYHVTDLWEAWIDLFEAVRVNADKNGIDNLWISLTCYTNPSPWFLQWANSVWLQCTHDRGESGPLDNKADKMLTYREAVYYDFIKNHEFQFPLSNIYNHDPVYGKEGTGMNINSMSDEQFSNYLYAQATRGTAFWELYYSDSMMNGDKYKINAEFLEWLEANYHILRNAKMFGGNPSNGVVLGGIGSSSKYESYGFSAWENSDGIISLRNPDNKEQTLTFTLDRNLGLPEGASNLQRTTVHAYKDSGDESEYKVVNYGDEITVTLQPGEVRVWQFAEDKDETAPTIKNVRAVNSNMIEVQFNEKVKDGSFTVENHEVEAIRPATDHKSYEITLKAPLKDGETVNITANDVKDLNDNVAVGSISATYYTSGKVLSHAKSNAAATINDGTRAISGTNAYTVNAKMTSSAANKLIMEQDNAYQMGIDADGKAYFEVAGTRAVSKDVVNTGKEVMVTGVKENNGLVKVFVNGELKGSSYNKDLAYKTVDKGATKVGDVKITNATVYDNAIGYTAIKNLVDDEAGTNLIPQSQMKASGTSFDGKEGSIPANAIDGNVNTYWATSPEASNTIIPQYLTLDLGGVYDVEKVTYMTRHDAQGGIGCTGNILEYVLETSEDGVEWTTAKTGTFTDNGKLQTITLDETVKANYIRMGATKTHHWIASLVNTVINVGEINVYGDTSSNVDKSALRTAVEDALAVSETSYTTASYASLTSAIEAAQVVLDNEAATIVDVNASLAELKGAMSNLVNIEELTSAIAAAKELNPADYTAKSFAVLTKALEDAEAVLSDGTNEDVAATIETIKTAVKQLVPATGQDSMERGILRSAVKKALIIRESGLDNIAQDVVNKFNAALDHAIVVLNNPESTPAQCMDAWFDLANAMHYLEFYADKTNLNALIVEADKINANLDAYEEEGKQEFIDALAHAKDIAASDSALNESINAARDRLATAMSKLVLVSDEEGVEKEILRSAVKKALIIRENGFENIPQIVVDQFNTALDHAVDVLNNTASTSEEMLDAWFALANAMHYLDFHADKTQLNALIVEADKINANLDAYKEEGKQEFIDALAHAKEVAASDTALDDSSINPAHDRLATAMSKLVLADGMDKTILEYFIQQAESAINEASYYEQNDAWTTFVEAYDHALDVKADADSQEAVNDAAKALADAYVDIRLIANEDLLKELNSFINAMNALDVSVYSVEDYAIIQNAKDFAQDLYARGKFTAEELSSFNEKKAAADEAVKRVVETPTTPEEPNDSVGPEDTAQPKQPADASAPLDEDAPSAPTQNSNVARPAGTTKTGDTTNIGIIAGVMVVALGAIVFIVVRKRKASKKEN